MPIKPRRRKDDPEPMGPFQDPAFRRSSIHFDDLEFQRRFEQNLIRFGLMSGAQVTEEINNSIVVSGGGGGGSGWCYWTKEGNNLVYYEGNVGVGIHPHSNDFHVKGNVLVAAADEQPYIEIRNWSDTARDPVLKWAVGATPSVKFTMGVDDSDSDKWKVATEGELGSSAGSYEWGETLIFCDSHSTDHNRVASVLLSDMSLADLSPENPYTPRGIQNKILVDEELGYIYVTDNSYGVAQYDLGLNFVRLHTNSLFTGASGVWGIIRVGSYFYVSMTGIGSTYDAVYRFNLDFSSYTRYLGDTSTGEEYLYTVRDLCYHDGYFYCADAEIDRISVWTLAGSWVRNMGSLGSGNQQVDAPSGIDTDGERLYIADYSNDRILVWGLDGTYVGQVALTGSPWGVTLNGTYIYANSTHSSSWVRITRIDKATLAVVDTNDYNGSTMGSGYTSMSARDAKVWRLYHEGGDQLVLHQDGTFFDVYPKLRAMSTLRLQDEADESAEYAEIKAPSGTVSASYTWTLPTAGPSAAGHLAISAAGVISYGQSLLATDSPSFVRLTLTQTTGTAPLTVSSTTVVTNLNADMVDGYHHDQSLLTTASPSFVALTLTQTVGTAPMTITSTTVVTNLNADLLDGKHEAAFVLIDGTRALTANWDAGSFKITAQTLESDVATGTAPLVIASTTLVSNLNADLLDGLHYTSFPQLVISATAAPTVNDDIDNYREGCLWIEQDADKCYICVDNADGAAVWQEVGAGGGALALDDLTDVNAPAPNDNDVLSWDDVAGEWVPVAQGVGALDLDDLGDVDAAAPNDDDILRFDVGSGDWKAEALPAAANHDLLSATHADTVASAVSRGSLIYGNSTPKWAELAVGAAGTLLKSDGTDVSWGTHDLLSASHGDINAQAVSRGSIIIGNSTPKWDELTIGASGSVLKSDGTDIAWAAQSSFKLDDFGACDDVTDLNVSTTAHGLCPKAPNNTTTFLRGDGTWAAPASADPWTYVVLSADFGTTSTVAVNVTNLKFTPAINKKYEFYGLFMLRNTNTSYGARMGSTFPANLADGVLMYTGGISNVSEYDQYYGDMATEWFHNSPSIGSTTESWPAVIRGILVTDASTSGDFQIRLRTENALGTATMRAGSFIKYRELT